VTYNESLMRAPARARAMQQTQPQPVLSAPYPVPAVSREATTPLVRKEKKSNVYVLLE